MEGQDQHLLVGKQHGLGPGQRSRCILVRLKGLGGRGHPVVPVSDVEGAVTDQVGKVFSVGPGYRPDDLVDPFAGRDQDWLGGTTPGHLGIEIGVGAVGQGNRTG